MLQQYYIFLKQIYQYFYTLILVFLVIKFDFAMNVNVIVFSLFPKLIYTLVLLYLFFYDIKIRPDIIYKKLALRPSNF